MTTNLTTIGALFPDHDSLGDALSEMREKKHSSKFPITGHIRIASRGAATILSEILVGLITSMTHQRKYGMEVTKILPSHKLIKKAERRNVRRIKAVKAERIQTSQDSSARS